MTEEQAMQLWDTYGGAWAKIETGEREKRLERSVAEDVIFADPDTEGRGREALAKHVASFQVSYPGAWFRTGKLILHHGQLLVEWTLMQHDGTEALTGNSYARIDSAGKLAQLTGFWKI